MDLPKKDDETCGFTIYWRIENFDSEPTFDLIKSQIFKIQSMNSNWQIELETEGDSLAAYLHKVTNAAQFVVNYSLSLLTSSGWVTLLANERERFRVGGDGCGEDVVNLEILKKNEWYYLPNGSLTINFRLWNERIKNESSQRVMISRLIDGDYLRHRPIQTFSTLTPSDLLSFPISYEFQSNSEYRNAKEMKSQQTQTDAAFSFKDLDELRQLFKEKEFSFVTLRTSTKEFSVHKAVLCAKSPVFTAMFEKNMKENECNVVDIDDIDNQTMALFVKFLQFEPLDDLNWSSAASLYYAADKYEINSLKEQCSSLLKNELSKENVCDLLVLADLHQDDDLMNYAQEYFCQHSKSILPSTQWKDILGHTELVAKILCKLAETMH
ncbi:protein maternal effect lethal 26 [Parasteatoda tepidariorum]|uniref:protein maternal effect lethal 26 n=1 Tax=Parasteatoda tepidariorum TaxID=114398 RepID=UPI001C7268F8|nr:protein maternal effect lethal 26 [Parasteatoda tepidariorum]